LPSALKHCREAGSKRLSGPIMTNRKLAYIVKDQKPLVLDLDSTVQRACHLMWERRAGSVLIIDTEERLSGIFTGRDAVRLLAKGNSGTTHLAKAMTPNPVTLTPQSRAIDAIKVMNEGNFRHVPVTEDGRILGVVSRGDFQGMEFEEFDWDGISRATEMTRNREIASMIKGQKPLVLGRDATIRQACRFMTDRKCGSVLVADDEQRLLGIFTGRDAVRLLANVKGSGETLGQAMKPDPVTITPDGHAVDALRTMSDGGFRHLPVVENARIHGVVSRSDFTGLEIDRLDEDVHLAECIW
jgi:CBS domain-containing protein